MVVELGVSGFLLPLCFVLCLLCMIPNLIKYVKKIGVIARLVERRTNLVNDAINGVKTVKFNAWEKIFYELIIKARDAQLRLQGTTIWMKSTLSVIFAALIGFTSTVCFSIYEIFVGRLGISEAFTVLVLINLSAAPLGGLAQSLYLVFDSKNSLRRLGEVLRLEENEGPEDDHLDGVPTHQPVGLIEIKKACLNHIGVGDEDIKSEEKGSPTSSKREEVALVSLKAPRYVLENITMKIEPGSFSVVVGKVGSGKSSLILSILGELSWVSGSIRKTGRIAYISQEAFLVNNTVKNNILFGLDYEEERYKKAVEISQLLPDLKILPQGDGTQIGERGINLSGGQKQRISVARAVYADADIYLIDDCLSALDAHVGRRVLQDVFLKELKSKTRLMVTHKLEVLASADYTYLIDQGRIVEQGTFEEIKETKEYQKFSEGAKSNPDEKTASNEAQKKTEKNQSNLSLPPIRREAKKSNRGRSAVADLTVKGPQLKRRLRNTQKSSPSSTIATT